MENSINEIPLPNFQFSDLVNRKAEDFYRYRLRNLAFDQFKIRSQIQDELWTLNKPQHEIQFIGFLISNIIEDITKHALECKNGANCRMEQNAQDVLYFLYGKLEILGLSIDIESFTVDEIRNTNQILNLIDSKLEYVKTGEELLYNEMQDIIKNIDSLKDEIKSLKGMYPLGKKKWKELFGGIILETITDKTMTEVIKVMQPYLVQLLPYIKEFFLLN